MIASIRSWAYRAGLLKSVTLPGYVISVGNISVGGTGKSPLVMLLAEWAINNKVSTAVLSRGYKRKLNSLVILPPNGSLPDAKDIGDEPWMIKNRIPGISLLVHKNRARMAARHWAALGSPKLVILDDAFQHWQVRRDLDIVMVDASESLDQNQIPFGRMRERATALRRANLVVITRSDSVSRDKLLTFKARLESIVKRPQRHVWQAEKIAKNVEVICCKYDFLDFLSIENGQKVECNKSDPLVLIAGVAKPDGVRNLAKSMGLTVEEELYFPDHHRLTSAQEDSLIDKFGKQTGRSILVTEKDWARWNFFLQKYFKGFVVRVQFQWLDDDEKKWKKFLEDTKKCFT